MATTVGVSVALGCAAGAPGRADGGTPNRQISQGRWVDGTFTSALGSRRYRLYVPGGYDATRQHGLVVLLHGCTQDPDDLARGTRIEAHVGREQWLALLPEQPVTANPNKCWNWYAESNQARGVGEPGILDGMIDDVMGDYRVDPARVHIGGISAGAAMASLMAVAYPERFASVAMHSGLAWRPATDVATALAVMARGAADPDSLGAAALAAMGSRARVMPALIVHGGRDAAVFPINGQQATRQWIVTNTRAPGGRQLTNIETTGETNGYRWTRSCYRAAGGTCVVEEWIIHELGHAWSGGSSAGTYTDERGPDIAAEMIRFFREHPRGRP